MVEDVLARARGRFSEYGYHASSVEHLLQAMGINRGSMYAMFNSKRELFLRVLRHHLETEGGLLQEIVEQTPSPMEAIMPLAARVATDRMMVRTAVELAAHDDEIRQVVAEAQGEIAHLFVALIERGQHAGEIDGAVDPVQTGRMLLGLCVGAGVIGTTPAALQRQAWALLPPPSGARA